MLRTIIAAVLAAALSGYLSYRRGRYTGALEGIRRYRAIQYDAGYRWRKDTARRV